jgi:hypothetical protein
MRVDDMAGNIRQALQRDPRAAAAALGSPTQDTRVQNASMTWRVEPFLAAHEERQQLGVPSFVVHPHVRTRTVHMPVCLLIVYMYTSISQHSQVSIRNGLEPVHE